MGRALGRAPHTAGFWIELTFLGTVEKDSKFG